MLTPAQSAAKQIADIEANKNAQLESLSAQQKLLDAQLEGKQELFGLQQDSNALLAEQVKLTQQQTSEWVKQVQLLQQFLKSNSDAFAAAFKAASATANPSLPGFGGSTYLPGNTVNLNGAVTLQLSPDMTPAQAWKLYQAALSYGSKLPGGPLKSY